MKESGSRDEADPGGDAPSLRRRAYGVLEVSTAANPGELSRYVCNGDKGSIVLSDTGVVHWTLSDKPEITHR